MAVATDFPDPHLGERQDATSTTGASSGSATVSKRQGLITTGSSLSLATGATYVLTLNHRGLSAQSLVLANARYGSATAGIPVVVNVVPTTDSVAITFANAGSAAFNGTMQVAYAIIQR